MRPIVLAGLLVALLPAAGSAQGGGAQGPGHDPQRTGVEKPGPREPAAPTTVTACDNLLTLRRIMAQDAIPAEADGDPEAPAPVVDRTGCREVESGAIGDTQRRTLIGGAPYECRTIGNGPCLWVRP